MTSERDPAKLRAFHGAKAALMASLAEDAPEDVEAQRAVARSQRELDTLKKPTEKSEKKARVLSIADARKKPRKPRA